VSFRTLITLLTLSALAPAEENFIPDIAANVTRPWPGKDFWSNPAEDWTVAKGRLENTFSGGHRHLVLLTAALEDKKEPFNLRVHLDQVSFELFGDGYVGFQVGLRGPGPDFRDAAVNGRGFPAGIDFSGVPFIGTTKADTPPLPQPLLGLVLELKGEPAEGELYRLSLLVQDATGKILRSVATTAHASWLRGLVALAASTQAPPAADLASPRPATLPAAPRDREGEGRFAFSKFVLAGGKLARHPERAFGPIQWVTHTFDNDGTLCLLAQAAPFGRSEKLEAELHLPGREPQFATLDPVSRSARFRVIRLNAASEIPYEVKLAGDSFKGVVRPAPANRPLKIASLTGDEGSGFPHTGLVQRVGEQKPDLITFLGNQIGEATGGYGQVFDHRPGDRVVVCYLRKYALHGWIWRDLLRDTPSITLPGAHDVFHRKLWGANGKQSDITRGYGVLAEDSGGYKMSVEFVNAVHRSQTGNLPDPADPAPCASGISVYFTRLAWGPLDLVLLADQQFKSAPKALLPAAKIEDGWPRASGWNPATDAAVEDADLLGVRQEAFLDRWARSPAKGAKFRVALSQNPFTALRTLPAAAKSDADPLGQDTATDAPAPDFAANSWPPQARAKALALLAEAKALHLCGGRAPAASGRYLLASGQPGPWWTTAAPTSPNPAIRWQPAAGLEKTRADAFGHSFDLRAVANTATGYLLTTWDPASGKIRVENLAAPANADTAPLPGWPLTLDPD